MLMSDEVIIVGAGGHGKVLADIVLQCGGTVRGFLDDDVQKTHCMEFPILGTVDRWPEYAGQARFLLAIGSNAVRETLAQAMQVVWYTAIHPSASIARQASIGEGTGVMAGAVINPCAQIGRHCIVNSAVVIEHDNNLEDYVHVSPHATLCGTVAVGRRTHIGAGATIKNNVSICADVTVGAGALVLHDIETPGTYVGVPVRRLP